MDGITANESNAFKDFINELDAKEVAFGIDEVSAQDNDVAEEDDRKDRDHQHAAHKLPSKLEKAGSRHAARIRNRIHSSSLGFGKSGTIKQPKPKANGDGPIVLV